ncbi:MFS transporter [Parapedomonas caeni]|jgi:MFS family permease
MRAELTTPPPPLVRNPIPGLVAVILHMGFVGATVGVLAPLTALRFKAWGASPLEVGLAGGMTALALLVMIPLLARLPRVNPTIIMGAGCAVGAAALVAMQLLPDTWAWIGLRFVSALGLTMPWLLGESWVNLAAPEHLRGRIVASYAAAFFVGFSAGPILIDIVGYQGWAPIIGAILFLVGAALPLMVARRYAPVIAIHGLDNPFPVLRRAPVVAIAALAAGLTESLCFGLFVVYGLDLGWGASQSLHTYTALLVGGIVLQYPIGWLADRWSRRRVLSLISMITALAVVGLSLVTTQPTVALLLSFLLGGGVLAFYSLGLILLGDHFHGEDVVKANAGFLLAYQGGSLVGPSLGGGAMMAAGPIGFTVVLAVAGGVLLALSLRRRV